MFPTTLLGGSRNRDLALRDHHSEGFQPLHSSTFGSDVGLDQSRLDITYNTFIGSSRAIVARFFSHRDHRDHRDRDQHPANRPRIGEVRCEHSESTTGCAGISRKSSGDGGRMGQEYQSTWKDPEESLECGG